MKIKQQTRRYAPEPVVTYKNAGDRIPRKDVTKKLRANNQWASVPSKHWDRHVNQEG